MTVEIYSAAVQMDDGVREVRWFARAYEDVIDLEGNKREETVRDWNQAQKNLDRLTRDRSCICRNEQPRGAVRIMSVYVNVLKTRKGLSQYRAAYRRHEFGGEYTKACEATMEVWRAVKKVLRNAQELVK